MGLVIFLGYYFILSAGFTLTKDASVSPWLTFWTTHLLVAIAGVIILRQSSLEKPNVLAVLMDQALMTMQKRASKNVNS